MSQFFVGLAEGAVLCFLLVFAAWGLAAAAFEVACGEGELFEVFVASLVRRAGPWSK